MNDRLRKLSALTRGAAVVGIGTFVTACTRTDPAPQPQAAAGVAADTTADADAGPDASVFRYRRRFPVPNAVPSRFRHLRGADAGPDAPDTDGSTGP